MHDLCSNESIHGVYTAKYDKISNVDSLIHLCTSSTGMPSTQRDK